MATKPKKVILYVRGIKKSNKSWLESRAKKLKLQVSEVVDHLIEQEKMRSARNS